MRGLFRLSGAQEHSASVGRWLAAQPTELGTIARHWFSTMRRCGSDVRELLHDGYATACVDDAAFAYVGVFKAHVNIGFFHGAALPDPTQLLQGTGRFMRHVKVMPGRAVDVSAIETLIAAAYRDILVRLDVQP